MDDTVLNERKQKLDVGKVVDLWLSFEWFNVFDPIWGYVSTTKYICHFEHKYVRLR